MGMRIVQLSADYGPPHFAYRVRHRYTYDVTVNAQKDLPKLCYSIAAKTTYSGMRS